MTCIVSLKHMLLMYLGHVVKVCLLLNQHEKHQKDLIHFFRILLLGLCKIQVVTALACCTVCYKTVPELFNHSWTVICYEMSECCGLPEFVYLEVLTQMNFDWGWYKNVEKKKIFQHYWTYIFFLHLSYFVSVFCFLEEGGNFNKATA